MEAEQQRRRKRCHSEGFKRQVVEACCKPGASVAGVAFAHGVNANLVRKWIIRYGAVPASRRTSVAIAEARTKTAPLEFLPVQIAPTPSVAIRLQIQRGDATLKIDWPVEVASDCGAWLREWLA